MFPNLFHITEHRGKKSFCMALLGKWSRLLMASVTVFLDSGPPMPCPAAWSGRRETRSQICWPPVGEIHWKMSIPAILKKNDTSSKRGWSCKAYLLISSEENITKNTRIMCIFPDTLVFFKLHVFYFPVKMSLNFTQICTFSNNLKSQTSLTFACGHYHLGYIKSL